MGKDGSRRSRRGSIPPHIGKYEVVQRLAEGGMAELFLVRCEDDAGRQQQYVIKRLLAAISEDAEFEVMFADEARLASSFDHPNLTRVFETGSDAGGPFFVMELLSGQDVWHILRSSYARNQFIPYAHTVEITAAVCAALHYAHELRDAGGKPLCIVHRDVSPQNIFVTHDGGVKLCDFGISKSRIQRQQTAVGTWKGKVRYMSPEQCRAEPVDRRSDVFALATVLWEMVMLRRLYSGDSDYDILMSIASKPPPRPSDYRQDVPAGLEHIIMKGLSARREDRFQTAAAMGSALQEWAIEAGARPSRGGLALFMTGLFGSPAASVSEMIERTTSADPLSKRIRALGWFEAEASDLTSSDQLVLLHLPGMGTLPEEAARSDEPSASTPNPVIGAPIGARRSSLSVPSVAASARPWRPGRNWLVAGVVLVVLLLGVAAGLALQSWQEGTPVAPVPIVPASPVTASPPLPASVPADVPATESKVVMKKKLPAKGLHRRNAR